MTLALQTPEIDTGVNTTVEQIARDARAAALQLGTLSTAVVNKALEQIATTLSQDEQGILTANAADVEEAHNALAQGLLSSALVDRLTLNPHKLHQMIASVRAVAALNDPVGHVLEQRRLSDGLDLQKITVPIGVVAVIFEARPDAVTQIAALTLKSRNAVILKGGHEARRTTRALVDSLHRALVATGNIPPTAIGVVEDRAAVSALLALDELIDLVVPRGSTALVRMVQEQTRIPVLGHAEGVCHVYVDRDADVNMAIEIVIDSKAQYPAACNATETLLIDSTIAPTILPLLLDRLVREGLEVRACPRTLALATSLASIPSLTPATDADWGKEYGVLTLACKVVDGVESAVAHINTYGSRHTDAIVTTNLSAAQYFLAHVDSACVFHNASTRFSDGYRFGLGAELGISTGKLHARGPVGLAGLTTYKYVLHGSGHTVATYTGPTLLLP